MSDNDLDKLRSELIDHTDKQLLEFRGDLVAIRKSEDRKLNILIELLVKKDLLSTSEAKTIIKMEPFPQGA